MARCGSSATSQAQQNQRAHPRSLNTLLLWACVMGAFPPASRKKDRQSSVRGHDITTKVSVPPMAFSHEPAGPSEPTGYGGAPVARRPRRPESTNHKIQESTGLCQSTRPGPVPLGIFPAKPGGELTSCCTGRERVRFLWYSVSIIAPMSLAVGPHSHNSHDVRSQRKSTRRSSGLRPGRRVPPWR